jgi:hypothetical protein
MEYLYKNNVTTHGLIYFSYFVGSMLVGGFVVA